MSSESDIDSLEEGHVVSVPTPIRGMGLTANDILTSQQKQSIVDMWERLRKGIVVMKHGRQGKPKQRVLYCDEDMQILYWKKLSGNNNIDESEHGGMFSTRRSSFSILSRFDSPREVVLREVLQVQ